MSLTNTILYYTMWVGVAICSVLLLPCPRLIRRPLVRGLEVLLTNTYMIYIQLVFLGLVCVNWANGFFQMRSHSILIQSLKGEKQAASYGATQLELEKSINHARMKLFLDQRNTYLSFFVLILFFIVFTYLYSLKKDDIQHEQLTKLQAAKQQPKPDGTTDGKAKRE